MEFLDQAITLASKEHQEIQNKISELENYIQKCFGNHSEK